MKSLNRLMAVMRKEVRQMRRDRLTAAMIVGIPIMQLLLFGYAIKSVVGLTPAWIQEVSGDPGLLEIHLDSLTPAELPQAVQVSGPSGVTPSPSRIITVCRTCCAACQVVRSRTSWIGWSP